MVHTRSMTAQGPQQPSEETLAEFGERVRTIRTALLAARGRPDAEAAHDPSSARRYGIGLSVAAEKYATFDDATQAIFAGLIEQMADALCAAPGPVAGLRIQAGYDALRHELRASAIFFA